MINYFKTAKSIGMARNLIEFNTTFYGTHTAPETGYVVGDSLFGIVIGPKVSADGRYSIVLAYVRATAHHLGRYQTLGSWTDTDGTLCIDPGTVVAYRDTAIRVAIQRGEKAIWDIEHSQEIRV